MSDNTPVKAAPPQLPILPFFAYAHLPPHLQAVSRPFGELADQMVSMFTGDAGVAHPAELAAGLRKLLEAKDCFVRCALPPRR